MEELLSRRRQVNGEGLMRRAGFFESAEEVTAAMTSGEHPDEQAAARYLDQGEIVVAASQWVDDLLDSDAKRICQYSIRTDGVWVWPSSLAYYVRKYHVGLPSDFLHRMASNNWTVADLEESAVDEVYAQLDDFTESNS
ncbi:hypothetical protein ACGFYZ_09055 [Streptomyces sp. NPDC048330]|uniref:hypothetical protein n=1 Tax=Streptomyces sp. NPDC048330 TaxID=3365533 RepID=UPI003716A9E3